jgi:hypothetical protein
VKLAALGAFGIILVALLAAPIQGMMSSPWAPFWFSRQAVTGGGQIAGAPEVPVAAVDPGSLAGHGYVSDIQRYQLARFSGWGRDDAITATAVSIAENGSGDPAALSGVNHNGTRDLGLWQINSAWWPEFGGALALTEPLVNVRAAFTIKGRQGWCAWSTFGPCPTHACGPPCYRSFLARAQQAADTPSPPNQA